MIDVPPAVDPDTVDRELARRSLAEFRRYVHRDAETGESTQLASAWQDHAADELDRFLAALEQGERPKLILQTPPQHGKSLLVADFVAYAIGRCPWLRTVFASYSAGLGRRANRHVRRLLRSPCYRAVFPATVLAPPPAPETQTEFELVQVASAQHAGSFRNTTIRGEITGQPVDLGVIDDPVKNRQEVESETQREHTWDWFTNEFVARLHECSGYLLILTRWHLDDLAGRMLREVDGVRVLSYPALSEGTGDPLGHPEGEALFPELQSRELLLEKRRTTPSSDWLALYQQRPVPREGAVVKLEYLARRYRERGANPRRLSLSLDTAIKAEQRHDPTAALLFAEFEDRAELWDCRIGRFEFPELVRWTRDLAAGIPGLAALLVEDKGSGQQLLQQLRREGGLPLVPIVPEGDKLTRMDTETPWLAAGNLWLPEVAPWVADFVAEVTTFPAAPHDDRVDALSQWLRWRREGEARLVDLSDACLAAAWGGGPTKESNRLRW